MSVIKCPRCDRSSCLYDLSKEEKYCIACMTEFNVKDSQMNRNEIFETVAKIREFYQSKMNEELKPLMKLLEALPPEPIFIPEGMELTDSFKSQIEGLNK